MVAHTFNSTTWESRALNPSPREVEIGRDMARLRENIRQEEAGAAVWRYSLRMQSEDAI